MISDPWQLNFLEERKPEPLTSVFRLHDFQGFAIEKVLNMMSEGKRTVLKAPTGAGKTVMASEIIRKLISAGKRVAFCVDAISLLDQTIERFYQYGLKNISVIQADHWMTNANMPLQICSAQTLSRRDLPAVDAVVIDECHCVFDVYKKWMADKPDVNFVGLTATPYTKGLGKMFSEVVVAETTRGLIEKKFLTPFRVFAYERPDISGVRTVAGDYHEVELARATDTEAHVGDVVSTWLKHGEDRPTFYYGVNREHALHVQKSFVEAGVLCGYIDANTQRIERREQFTALKKGELNIIASIGCLTKGIDEPHVSCIILDRNTKSRALYQQIIGRGLRTNESKDNCLVIDHTSSTYELGYVTDIDDEFDGLDDGKKKKSKSKKKKRKPVECSKCRYLKPPGSRRCPNCGFTPAPLCDVEYKDGELRELDMQKKVRARNKNWTPEQKRSFFAQLKSYANDRNYKPGWAAFKYKTYFGVWPNAYKDTDPIPCGNQVRGWILHEQIKWAKAQKKKEQGLATGRLDG